jgi:putative transposase
MRKRYSEEQIVKILKEAEVSGKPKEVCRRHGVSDQTLRNWRTKFGDLGVSEVRKLKGLEDENRRLKKIVAEKELDLDALRALLEKYGQVR